MADLKFISRILSLIGGIILILVGIIKIIDSALEQSILGQFGLEILQLNFLDDLIGTQGWLITAALMIICGLIAIFIYQKLKGKKEGSLLVYGIVLIILGLVGETLGGLLLLLAGIVLIIDYFL